MAQNTSSPMKIMHILGSKGAGGAETFFIRLVEALHIEKKHTTVLPVVRENSWASEELTKRDIPHKTAPFSGRFDFKTKKLLKQYIDEAQPDVIQSWMSRATKFLPKTSIPTAARLGGYYNLKYYKNKVQYLIGNTQDIVDYTHKKNWPAQNTAYIPNFTILPPQDLNGTGRTVRDRYGLTNKHFLMLLAGRLHECKGFDLILHIMNQLPNHVHLMIAGDGKERAAFEATVDADNLNNRVHFLSWVNNITPVAAACDAWVVPSRIEPLGNTVLDAWGHKVPVAASRAVGPAQLITDGEDGLLFDIDDAAGAKAALLKLIQDSELRKTLNNKGFETLTENFSKEKVVQQYIDFYTKITKDKAS